MLLLAFNDDTDVEYKLKLFGLASRQMNDEFKLLLDVALCAAVDDALGAHPNDNCGFDVE